MRNSKMGTNGGTEKTQNACKYWSGRQDSNLRPLAPHASALPGCATPRPRKRMISQKSLGNSNAGKLAAKNFKQFFEFEPHLMNQLLTLVEINLRIVARKTVPGTANGEPLLIQQTANLANDKHILPLIVAAVTAPFDRL